MSDENTSDEVKTKVTISGDDCSNVKKYCGHFGVPSSDDLDKALDLFTAEPTYENQLAVKLEICKWMLSCPHESFQDSLWDAPKKAAEEVVYDLQFDKDLKSVLSEASESEENEK